MRKYLMDRNLRVFFQKIFLKKENWGNSVLPGAPLGQFAGNTPAAHPPHLLLVDKLQKGNTFLKGVERERFHKR